METYASKAQNMMFFIYQLLLCPVYQMSGSLRDHRSQFITNTTSKSDPSLPLHLGTSLWAAGFWSCNLSLRDMMHKLLANLSE